MNVRIIAGKYGGRTIDAPDRRSTHAMGERIRNAMFNSIGNEVQNARVLDAFAGSGSIGIEALSRGASEVVFVEKDRIAAKIIAKNIQMLNIAENTTLIAAPAYSWADSNSEEKFDIIFADPPYHDTQFSTVEHLMGLLKPGALMVLSHPGRGETPSKTGVVVVDNRSYGNADLTYFRRES
ncbi:MAG TPA: 16S rRNA (guanine(966)-N(2))-methyltransferase RsmD [Candidatus Saccharibacteria bacterium]|nr:16S rRNA (guanine(966)-N(2))-methyltransferase RsmD [Candidatus Saccharibacteria bacterium]